MPRQLRANQRPVHGAFLDRLGLRFGVLALSDRFGTVGVSNIALLRRSPALRFCGLPPADFDELVFVTGSLDEPVEELCRRAVESPLPDPSGTPQV